MLSSEAITAIVAGVAALIGSGGVTALVHEISVRHKVKADAAKQSSDLESQKSAQTTEMMKYFTDEIKRINEETKVQLDTIRAENSELKKQVTRLNGRLTDLVRWIMYDNNNYRTWLERTIRELDPNIAIPPCTDPPVVWDLTPVQADSEIENA